MNRLAWIPALALLLVACSGPPPGESYVVAPTFKNFNKVNDALGASCGTLDCHGQQGRNMRVWSKYGMRLQVSTQNPPIPGSGQTTAAEVLATYRSVVGLEPEIMSQVVEDGGRDPQRLTMIRKARGTESHKGHKVMSVGDPLDVCITSWLAGNVNVADCNKMAPNLAVPPAP